VFSLAGIHFCYLLFLGLFETRPQTFAAMYGSSICKPRFGGRVGTEGLRNHPTVSSTEPNEGFGSKSVADPAMGGQGGRPPPPIDQNLGLTMAA